MNPDAVTFVVARVVEDVGLLTSIGTLILSFLAQRAPRLPAAVPSLRVALCVALAGSAFDALDPNLSLVARLGTVAFLVAALAGSWFDLATVWPFIILASITLAASGHAAHLIPPAPAVAIDALHVLAAGAWAGGIVTLALMRVDWREDEGRDLLARFGRVASIAFAVTALTGVLRGTEELTGFADLVRTPYGEAIALKSIGVLAMIAMSAFAWRRFRAAPRIEAGLAAVVIGLTALLSALSPPAA